MKVIRDDIGRVYDALNRRRNALNTGEVFDTVRGMMADIAARGDDALFEYIERFDGVKLSAGTLRVTPAQIDEAYASVEDGLVDVIRRAAQNIREYHALQRRDSLTLKREGGRLDFVIRPLERAGVYVPGGKAAYPSSVLMNVIPAKVAGVAQVCMATPSLDPLTLVAADVAGADVIYRMGGAHAVLALALGTNSVPKVDKITGPGNIYVAAAKKLVSGLVGTDMIAGPSEVLIIADKSANPAFIAADFLSQAEHDELAACVLICTDEGVADKAAAEIERQLASLEKRDIAQKSLDDYGFIILTDSIESAADIANEIAPEHLEVLTESPRDCLPLIKNAGSVFLGEYSPEPLGDYYAGANHILPTNGTARFSSPLNVDDFTKKMSVIEYSKEGLYNDYKDIERFARAEGLTAHARSAAIRFEEV